MEKLHVLALGAALTVITQDFLGVKVEGLFQQSWAEKHVQVIDVLVGSSSAWTSPFAVMIMRELCVGSAVFFSSRVSNVLTIMCREARWR